MIKLARLNGKPEIFHSIQGEGKNMGRPSIFIRLSLCNLYCIWCDTDYTWNWEGTRFAHNYDKRPGYKKYDKEMLTARLSNAEIYQAIKNISCNNLVITGGEPLVQQKDLVHLLSELKTHNPGYHVEFETNGTLVPLPELDRLADQYNVSVKLSNSNVALEDRWNPGSLAFFAKSPKASFKFVIDTQADLEEVMALVNGYGLNRTSVFLMPQGTTAESLRAKQQWLVEICKNHGFNYTDRMHIHIWGDKRGV